MTPADVGFSPYVLFRRGTLELPALAGLVPQRSWELLDRAAAISDATANLRERITAELHRIVPNLPADLRGAVLRIRRCVHNGRPAEPLDELPATCRALLAEWARAHAAIAELSAEAESVFAAELETARKTLADVALREDFQRGVQLSGEDVHREVRGYAADPFDRGRKPSRQRRVESTITSFAYRVVFKPSPFGSFTEIGARPWARPRRPDPGGDRVRQSRVSIGLLAWMAHQVHRIERSEEILRVRLNNSLVLDGDLVRYVFRPLEGAEDAMIADRVITARDTDLVRLLVDTLGEGDLAEHELRDRLVAAGLTGRAARELIDSLTRIGLCHRGFGLPDQTPGLAGAVAARLRLLDTDQARRAARIFERTAAIEMEFAGASAVRRTEVLAELRDLVHRLAAVCGCRPPHPEALRGVLYEDVGTRADAATWDPALLARNAANVALFQRIVPVLDDATIERLGLYRFHLERFGATEVRLIDLYAAFRELSPVEAGRVMSGVDDPHCAELRELRHGFGELLEHRAGDAELVLDPGRLAAFAASVPTFVPRWRSAAYRVQIGHDGDPLVVVNGVTTGHGVFFSRFCELLRPGADEDWDLAAELAAHIRATAPRQTDITATLGLNFNLHPALTPHELVYPGSVPCPGATGVHTLADVVVRPDPARRRLNLVSIVDSQVLDLVPMNFLFPAAAPMLYRFLCAFAPTRTYRGGLWEQVDRNRGELSTGPLPRIRLGDLVLDRRSWRFAAADLPDLRGLERLDFAAAVRFERWRAAAGLPRHSFFRVLATPAAEPGAERDLLEETRQWALAARSARLHKPHYLDTHNPFLLAVLAKQAGGPRVCTVVFQECLPAPEEYTGPGPGAAEEFFIEYTEPGR